MKRLSLIIGLAFLSSCGSQNSEGPFGDGSDVLGYCMINNNMDVKLCVGVFEEASTSLSAKNYCAAKGGSFSDTPCSTKNLTGTCKVSSPRALIYYYSPMTLETGQHACQIDNGVFSVGDSAPCKDNWGRIVLSGSPEERTRYKTKSSDDKCVSEKQTRICTNGNWSQWSGTYTEETCKEATCQGFSESCYSLGSSSCLLQKGCELEYSCQGTTSLSSYSCSSISNESTCDAIPGCYWTSNYCTGSHYFNLLTQSECNTVRNYGLNCSWAATCKGITNSCYSITDANSCKQQSGCSWK